MATLEIPEQWDHEADVVVIGGGAVGLPAGIVVKEAGFTPVVLESRPKCGGSFAMLAGGFAVCGSDEQKAAGIEDSKDLFYEDCIKISHGDPELIRAYVDNHYEGYRMLKEQGIEWPGILSIPGHSVPRVFGWLLGFGPKLVKAFLDRANDRGVEILRKHRAKRLIVNPQTGRVIGVKVNVGDEVKNFKAKRAVIIGTGGFGQNSKIIAEFAPHMLPAVPKMPVGHQGDGLIMGLDVGVALKDMGVAVTGSWPVCVETHSRAIWSCDFGAILVNKYGQRFHNEGSVEGFYGPMTEAGMRQPGGFYWSVFDQKVRDNIGIIEVEGTSQRNEAHVRDIDQCKKYEADTYEDLAKEMDIEPQSLKETIDKYNSDIEKVGYDTVFNRKYQHGEARPVERIDTPPFYAIKCVTSTTSMKGGLKIDASCHAVNNFGEVIPGLYAAGEATGGLCTKSYILGTLACASVTQGIIAARNAVKEPSID